MCDSDCAKPFGQAVPQAGILGTCLDGFSSSASSSDELPESESLKSSPSRNAASETAQEHSLKKISFLKEFFFFFVLNF